MQTFLRLARLARGWRLRGAAISAAFLLLASPIAAWAEGQLLPNAEQTFVDLNGRPLAAGQVYFYIPNTTTLKDTWKDAAFGVLNTNPVVLDAAGRAIIYGSGHYSQKVLDVHGNLQWNQKTQTVGTVTSLVGEHGVYTTPDPLIETGLIGCRTATVSLIGCVIPDGATITVDGDGVISASPAPAAISLTAGAGITVAPSPIIGTGSITCKTSTTAILGCVIPDGKTITVTGGGTISALTAAPTITSFTTPGAISWTVPAGVTLVRKLTVVGGGGAGGFGAALGGVASGGSAGSTGIKINIPVNPGDIIPGVVGAAGAGNLVGVGGAGVNSTITINGTTYTAPGGPGGLATAGPTADSPALAADPTNFDASTSYVGGQGVFGLTADGGVESGQGGAAVLGGQGGVGGAGIPSPGRQPGGGGGGSGNGITGGNGGAGVIYIEFIN